MKIDKDLIAYLKSKMSNNEIDILKSKEAYCLFCRGHFSARHIADWHTDKGVTAICPECGMPSVVGDACGYHFDHDELRTINKAIYGPNYMKQHPSAIYKFLDRYFANKITHKKENEELVVKYLKFLEARGDKEASFRLGILYGGWGEFIKPSYKKSITHFDNARGLGPHVLTHIAFQELLAGDKAKGTRQIVLYWGAYEHLVEAMALGDQMAKVQIADCYLYGEGIEKDVYLAHDILLAVFKEAYKSFYLSRGAVPGVLSAAAARLGKFFYNEDQPSEALPFYLIALLAHSSQEDGDPFAYNLLGSMQACQSSLERIARENGLEAKDPVFDSDTFFASYFSTELNFPLNPTSMPRKVSKIEFDKEEKTLTLTLENIGGFPPLILDPESLFCSFVEGPIQWTFEGVKDVKMSSKSTFNEFEVEMLEDGEVLRFTDSISETKNDILEIYFEEQEEETNKA